MTLHAEALLTGDTATPLVLPVPSDLADALEAEPAALRSFERLSYSRQRRLAHSVAGAKQPGARRHRVVKAVTMLKEGRTR